MALSFDEILSTIMRLEALQAQWPAVKRRLREIGREDPEIAQFRTTIKAILKDVED